MLSTQFIGFIISTNKIKVFGVINKEKERSSWNVDKEKSDENEVGWENKMWKSVIRVENFDEY